MRYPISAPILKSRQAFEGGGGRCGFGGLPADSACVNC